MSLSFDWVIKNELAVGKSPKLEKDLDFLKTKGIKSVLSLCSDEEGQIHSGIKTIFNYQQFILPDHKKDKSITSEHLEKAINNLSYLIKNKPVYVHCVASVERSPLVCMAWLLKTNYLTPIEALEYMNHTHKLTNPLPGHLATLNELFATLQ